MDASQGVPGLFFFEKSWRIGIWRRTKHRLNNVDGICMDMIFLYQLVQEIHSYLTVWM